MGGVSRFEDLIAWKKARELTRDVYRATKMDPFRRDFALSGQIRRASISIMSNIAEGFERHRPGEFHQFLSIAKGSCAELRSQLYVAMDVGYLETESFQGLLYSAEELKRIIGGLRLYIHGLRKQ